MATNFQLGINYYNKIIEKEWNKRERDDFYLSKLFNERGYLYYRMVEFFPAMDDFSCAILLNPTNDIAFFNRGQVYYRLNQMKDGILDFNRSLQLNPTFEEALMFKNSAETDFVSYL